MSKKILTVFLFVFTFHSAAFAETISSALINSMQTYVVNDEGESLQEYNVGDLVYVVVDSKLGKGKKHRDFYRVTFDPTNPVGDGWVQKDKVKLMTTYRSVDGKEPTEYERKAVDVATSSRGSSKSSSDLSAGSGLGTSDASSFLDELVKKDSGKAELKSLSDLPKVEAPKKNEKNPLEDDLEFLFQQDGEFKNTMKQTKATVKASMTKKVGVSRFASGSDAFANSAMDQFISKLKKDSGQADLARVAYASDLESPNAVTVDNNLDGVFFGQMSPKIGEARLLKVKYYDRALKQFTFEKVAKIPLTNSTKTIETLAHDCYQFVSK